MNVRHFINVDQHIDGGGLKCNEMNMKSSGQWSVVREGGLLNKYMAIVVGGNWQVNQDGICNFVICPHVYLIFTVDKK